MERWRGRVAVVTGASAGMGAAITYQLQDAGVDVVALARRKEKIPEGVESARAKAKSNGRDVTEKAPTPGKLHCLKCDISKEEDILSVFKWIKENTKGVDILVNNAGPFLQSRLLDNKTADWKTMLDTNVLGLSICTREAVLQMKARGVDDGHIIHIGSDISHTEPLAAWPLLFMYQATKHGVRVLTEGLRKELVAAKSRIRVSEVSPGLVETSFGNDPSWDKTELLKHAHLQPEDIADAVLYVLRVPPHVQIHEVIVLPVGQEY